MTSFTGTAGSDRGTDPTVTQLLSSKDDGSTLFSRNPTKTEDRDR